MDRSRFYQSYDAFKEYRAKGLSAKTMRRYDSEFWHPTGCATSMRVLDLGCGTAEFLDYLAAKGVGTFVGVEQDPKAKSVMRAEIAERVVTADIGAFLDGCTDSFDRITLFDVLEHFSADEGAVLMGKALTLLPAGGALFVRVPNAASPFGLQYQNGDLTHRTAYAPSSLRQLGAALGCATTVHPGWVWGSKRRRTTGRWLLKLASWCLPEAPEIWEGNICAVLRKA